MLFYFDLFMYLCTVFRKMHDIYALFPIRIRTSLREGRANKSTLEYAPSADFNHSRFEAVRA